MYNSELKPLHDLAPAITYLGHKIALRVNKSVFPVTQKQLQY